MSELPLRRTSVSTLEEQRSATRFRCEPGMEYAAVWQTPGEERLLEVFDESLGGLALLVPSRDAWPVGTDLTVAYRGELLQAQVRHQTPHTNDRVLIGLRCSRWPG